MLREKFIVGLVILSAALSCVLVVGIFVSPSVQSFRNVVGSLLDDTTTSSKTITGATIGALSLYLARRKTQSRKPTDRDGSPSLPRSSADRELSVSVPRTTSVEPIGSASPAAQGLSGPNDELGDTVSGDNSTGGDATSETESGPDIVNPMSVDSEKKEQLDEVTTQEGGDQKKTGDSTSDPVKEHIDTEDYQYDWVTETDVDMTDVGGLGDIKKELRQDIITPMREEPKKAEKFAIPLPNVLLHGPPGTGKTHLAKALATEIRYPFVNLSGSDVTSKWVNESTEQIGQLFDEAEALAEVAGGAVIFLDELDAVLPERQMDSHGEDRKVVNEFLSHLQESARERVLFVGATNRRDDLDPAATRNGRIDKEIFVGEPDHEERVEIIKAQLNERPHDLNQRDIEYLAGKIPNAVAADIESLVNQAARHAAYGRNGDRIKARDIEQQLDQ